MKRIFTAHWFVALAGALAYLGTTFFCFSTTQFTAPPRSETEENEHTGPVESWVFHNPEVDRMVEELRREKESLTLREQQMKDLETRLTIERQELGVITDVMDRVQRELDETILRIKQEETPNLKKLAKIHAAMSAEGSANILKEQTDAEVLKVLYYLKPAETGPILEAFGNLGKAEAQRAAQLTERLRRSLETPAEKPKS